METPNGTVSTCRCCHYYNVTGRRGGYCEMLGVSVRGGWKGCHLAVTQFTGEEIWAKKRELVPQET